jgi:hypothetical protein
LIHPAAVDVHELTRDRVTLPWATVHLDRGVGHGLSRLAQSAIATTDEEYSRFWLKETGPIRGALCRSCLVLRVPVETGRGQSAMIVVIDPATGRPFAYYGEGGYSHSFPPVPWRR